MISKIKKQRKSISAFTLIEMVIVLIIIGILLMATLYFSGDQIQKVRDKTVKESILAEWQSRYSRNLGSSSYAGMMYKYLDISIASGDNNIKFEYGSRSGMSGINNEFMDKFVIKKIITNPNDLSNYDEKTGLTFRYYPYQIVCERGTKDSDGNINTGDMRDRLLFVTRVNNSRDYCFEIQQKNCRLMDVSQERCEGYLNLAN